VLQKFADSPLTDCPQCHKPAFNRMITAPTFQLKGTGWYVTDFRGGKTGGGGEAGDAKPAGGDGAGSAPAPAGDGGSVSAAASKPAADSPATAASSPKAS